MAFGDRHNERISRETVRRAVSALLKWKKSNSEGTQKPQLLAEKDDCMYLMVTLRKIPQQDRTTLQKIPLPHPLHPYQEERTLFSELCLIIDDRPKSKPGSKLTSEDATKKIKSEEIPITKVLRFTKLKSDYQSFEAKRKLCDSYDMFLADKRVVPLLPKLLGKSFFKKKRKVPVPVDLAHKNWKEQIETACSSALLCLSTGTCSVLKIGNASMESGSIVENVLAAIDGIAEVVPRKWGGVRSFHLKFSNSLALPIYQALPEMESMKIEGIKGEGGEDLEVKDKRRRNEETDRVKKSKKQMIYRVGYMNGGGGEADELASDDEE